MICEYIPDLAKKKKTRFTDMLTLIIHGTLKWGDYPDGPIVVTYITIIKLFSIRIRSSVEKGVRDVT